MLKSTVPPSVLAFAMTEVGALMRIDSDVRVV
jgi:hypothetical protein